MVHKKEEGAYHCIETLTEEMPGFLSPGRDLPLLLIPEYSGINKAQRIPERSKTAHRKPPVKCFLTLVFKSTHSTHPLSLCDEPRRAESLFLAQVSSAVLGDSSRWVSWQRDRETEKGIVRGRETERQRQRDRDTETETETQRQRHRDREMETETQRWRQRDRDGDREMETERHRDGDRDTEAETQRQRDGDREKETERHRDGDRETETQRQRQRHRDRDTEMERERQRWINWRT